MNVAIEITPFGMGRLHRRTFRLVVSADDDETLVWIALQRMARKKSSWLAWLGVGFSYEDILFGSRTVYYTDDLVTQ